MKSFSILIIFTSITILSNTLYSQDSTNLVYGIDPVLDNGRLYSFNLSYKTQGHPYIYTTDYEPGYVTIQGRLFNNVLLNYDIYNQELVLKHINLQGSVSYIILSKAWLNKFSLHNIEFELIETGDGQKRFFQVIGQDTLKVLHHWEKQLTLSLQTGNKNYNFTEPVKTMYLSRNEGFNRFRNNKSFIALFEPGRKDLIKKYLKQNRINVKKASDDIMLNLISYCSQLEN